MSVRNLRAVALVLAVLVAVVSLSAQTRVRLRSSSGSNPLSLPLYDPNDIVYEGSFTYDWPDGAGGDLSYGGSAMGVSEDGNTIYLACNVGVSQMGIAKINIPTLGNQATVAAPCAGPTQSDLADILPAQDGGAPRIGGVLEQNGKITVSGYWTYDANGDSLSSHWHGNSLSSLSGPFLGAWLAGSPAALLGTAETPGLIKDHIAPIPSEWRTILGGPAMATAGYTSIISRASYGAAVSIFDPANVTADNFPINMLLGCPDEIPACVTYGSPQSDEYNGSELSGGAFIIPGTRTLVAIEREASGPTCYGYTTHDPMQHGLPYLDAVYCYSLSDPLDVKGPKGYPYRLVAKLYDLADLVNVKNGLFDPWEIDKYQTFDMPSSSASEFVNTGAFNPVRRKYYLQRFVGGGVNTIYQYGFP